MRILVLAEGIHQKKQKKTRFQQNHAIPPTLAARIAMADSRSARPIPAQPAWVDSAGLSRVNRVKTGYHGYSFYRFIANLSSVLHSATKFVRVPGYAKELWLCGQVPYKVDLYTPKGMSSMWKGTVCTIIDACSQGFLSRGSSIFLLVSNASCMLWRFIGGKRLA